MISMHVNTYKTDTIFIRVKSLIMLHYYIICLYFKCILISTLIVYSIKNFDSCMIIMFNNLPIHQIY